MKVVIDTNSLISLVRYYLPFDKNSILKNFIKTKIQTGEILIIDKVMDECTYFSKGLVLKSLIYLTDKTFLKSANLPIKTDSLIAPSPAKLLRQIDNQFVNTLVKIQRKLTEVEYENQKTSFLNDADMKLLILCLNLVKENQDSEIILVTEESEASNDNKLFKKIPFIARELGINTKTLPELLDIYEGIDFEFK